MEGAPPSDPSILEGGASDQAPGPSQQQAQAAAAAPPPVQRPTHTSNGSFSAPPRAQAAAPTRQQPQAHQLLSSAFNTRNARTAAAPPPVAAAPAQVAAPVAPAAPAPATASQDLFSLDFHAPSPASTPGLGAQAQPKKDVKNNIMALFSAAPSQPASGVASAGFGSFQSPSTAAWGQQQQQQAIPPQTAQSTSMIGSAGVGAWGASSGWGAPQAAQQSSFQSNNGLWGAPASAAPSTMQAQGSLFNTSDVWGSVPASAAPATTNNASQDLFGGFTSAATPAASAKKDDDAFGDIWGGFK